MTRDETIHNEKTKYTATWLNAASVACLTSGVLAPVAGLIFGAMSTYVSSFLLAVLVVAGSTCFALRIQSGMALERLVTDDPI